MTIGKKFQLLKHCGCLAGGISVILIYFDCCKIVLPVVLLGTVAPIFYLFIPAKKKLQKFFPIAAAIAVAAAGSLIPVRYAVSSALIIILAMMISGAVHNFAAGRKDHLPSQIISGAVALSGVVLLAVVVVDFSRINVYSDMRVFIIAFGAVCISLATADIAA